MVKARSFASALAVSALLGMTGCSMFGGGHQEAAATPPPAPAPAPAPTPPPPQNVELTRGMVRQVQTTLKHDHLYPGRVDGVYGPQTEHGVMQFQQQNNLQATGKIDVPTLQAMNLGNLAPQGSQSSGGMSSGTSGENPGGMPTNMGGAPPTNPAPAPGTPAPAPAPGTPAPAPAPAQQ
jgi:peptidoglycan hydrolase-like protein with peptidoglycan-binding domain